MFVIQFPTLFFDLISRVFKNHIWKFRMLMNELLPHAAAQLLQQGLQ